LTVREERATYPIHVDVNGRSCLVVGLGSVGMRRALGLLEAGARVTGVDPNASGAAVPDGVDLRREPYCSEHLAGVHLAFAAATDDVNRRVVADARARGTWVNSASDPEMGDFSVPAVWRDGPITLSVGTGGASPALARALCNRAAGAVGLGAEVAAIVGEARSRLKRLVADPRLRSQAIAALGDEDLLVIAETEGIDSVRKIARSRLDVVLGQHGQPSC
jgi:siroheme synthase-like protein